MLQHAQSRQLVSSSSSVRPKAFTSGRPSRRSLQVRLGCTPLVFLVAAASFPLSPFQQQSRAHGARSCSRSFQVCNALTRTRKEEIVADLKSKLEESVIVFGWRFKGLNVSSAYGKGLAQTIRDRCGANGGAGRSGRSARQWRAKQRRWVGPPPTRSQHGQRDCSIDLQHWWCLMPSAEQFAPSGLAAAPHRLAKRK